jgi:hypothetical protein
MGHCHPDRSDPEMFNGFGTQIEKIECTARLLYP